MSQKAEECEEVTQLFRRERGGKKKKNPSQNSAKVKQDNQKYKFLQRFRQKHWLSLIMPF